MSTPLRHGCADHISNPQEDCEYCKASNRVLEAARSSEGAVTCSDLAAELEAALVRLGELRQGTSEVWGWDEEWTCVQTALSNALDRERSRSATD